MTELGQLEAHHEEFSSRKVRIIAASLDNLEETAKTQAKFPHLILVSDTEKRLAYAAELVGPHFSPYGGETLSPTTFLVDRGGQVRWVFRPDRYLERLPASELLARIDEHLGKKP